eukprot:scaffold63203_cov64-Phaeocystis_antarctica.AAC.2
MVRTAIVSMVPRVRGWRARTCLGGAGGELGGEHEVREDVDGEGRLQVLRRLRVRGRLPVLRRAAQWQRLHARAQQRALDALRQLLVEPLDVGADRGEVGLLETRRESEAVAIERRAAALRGGDALRRLRRPRGAEHEALLGREQKGRSPPDAAARARDEERPWRRNVRSCCELTCGQGEQAGGGRRGQDGTASERLAHGARRRRYSPSPRRLWLSRSGSAFRSIPPTSVMF